VSHGAGLALITPVYISYMCAHDKKFKQLTIELSEILFSKKSVSYFINKIKSFIKLLDLPIKLTDFKEIKKVTKQDIE
jgi:alcohol dehydrogenase YqhD (iron-dependent ADH family)